jgi:hypothetical protein
MKTSKSWSAKVVTVAIVLGMMVIVITFIANWNIASKPIKIFSYGKNIALSDSNGSSSEPQVAATEKGDVYVVWRDETTGNGDIYFRKSANNGSTFDATIDLSNNSGLSFWPKIYLTKNNTYVLWVDNSTGNKEIYFKRISDNGSSVTTLLNVSNSNGSSSDPQIAAMEKGDVYVVWRDETTGNGDIYFRKSPDYGDTFKNTKNLRGNNGSSSDPQIAATEKGDVYVVWRDETTGNGDIYFRKSADYGDTFKNTKNLRGNNGSSSDPQIAATEKGDVYVVWRDETTGNGDIYFRKSADYGDTFKNTKNLRGNNGSSSDPNVVSGNDDFFVIWNENTNKNSEILFQTIQGDRSSFDNSTSLSENPLPHSPKIYGIGNNIYIVWIDKADSKNSYVQFKHIYRQYVE